MNINYEKFSADMAEQGLILTSQDFCEVPMADGKVQCGYCNGGLLEGDSTVLLPEACVPAHSCISMRISGQSMVGYGLNEGDTVVVRVQQNVEENDLVIALVNGSYTLKCLAYDDDNEAWLCPANDAYEAKRLRDCADVHIVGKVELVVKNSPRGSSRLCREAIRRTHEMHRKQISPDSVKCAIVSTNHFIERMNNKGLRIWYAVYRSMVDHEVVVAGDYLQFVKLLEEALGEEAPRISIRDFRSKMEVGTFAGPVEKWRLESSPVESQKRFDEYMRVASFFAEAL